MLQDVDCVYHLAARVSVAQSMLYPRDYNDANVGGTVSVMEAMRDAGVRRVVLASSGAIYGDLSQQPVSEEMNPNPDSPYAVSKWAAEQYVHTIGHLWGIETVALRIFNAYGPRQSLPLSHAPVVPRFLLPGPQRRLAGALRRRRADARLHLRRRRRRRPCRRRAGGRRRPRW
jgi:UDP-glucose 4-epimerase